MLRPPGLQEMEAGLDSAGGGDIGEELPRKPAARPSEETGQPPPGPASERSATPLLFWSRGKPSPIERQAIVDALEQCRGNQTKAASLLGISRGTLVARLALYGLPRPRGSSRRGDEESE